MLWKQTELTKLVKADLVLVSLSIKMVLSRLLKRCNAENMNIYLHYIDVQEVLPNSRGKTTAIAKSK